MARRNSSALTGSSLDAAEFLDDRADQLRRGFARCSGVHRKHARIGIGRQVAANRVRQSLPFADILKQPRRHSAAENNIQQRRRVAPLVRQRIRRHAEHDVDLFEFLLVALFDAGVCLGALSRAAAAPARATPPNSRATRSTRRACSRFPAAVMTVLFGAYHDAKTFEQRVARKLRHRFRSAQNRQPQRMPAPEILREQFVDQVFGIVLVHLDLFEDHLFFLGDVRVVKSRAQHQVGEHVERDRQVLVEHLRVEAGHFLGREGVEHPAHRVHRLRDFFGRALLGALEDHVLDEMRDPVALGRFAARSRAQPDAHRNRTHVRHLLRDDHEAVRQFRRSISRTGWLIG